MFFSARPAAIAVARPAGRGQVASRTLRRVRRYGPMVAACFLLSWGVAFGWWLLLPSTRTVEVVIPPGTAEAVAAGRVDSTLPDRLELRQGDTLVIRNEDLVVHRLGTSTVPSGHTVRMAVTPALLGAAGLVCSFHPAGSIGVAPLARPGVVHTVIPTLLAGVPLSITLVLSVAIASRLNPDERESGEGDG